MSCCVAIIQARMGSTRLPGKVLSHLDGRPLLAWVVQAAQSATMVDRVVVATTSQESDQPIATWCQENGIDVFRGNEKDVLKRYYDAAQSYEADLIVRLTADCPLLAPSIIDQVVSMVHFGQANYASNTLAHTWPDGLDCEAFRFDTLEKAHLNASNASDREHVTPYITGHRHLFRCLNLSCPVKGLGSYRWTVDTKEDLEHLSHLLAHATEKRSLWTLAEIEQTKPATNTETSPQAKKRSERNEGLKNALKDDPRDVRVLDASKALHQRSLRRIPFGCQTFSKSYLQFPKNTTPMFLTHGQGAKVWDIDGNDYVDLISGLLSIVLGYDDVDVHAAIQEQLTHGISFSLATTLEVRLAEKLCALIPCAEKVKFGKNGTDVTSAAVRLARAYTGRDKILMCGYHGWQDWSIGATTRNKGIPAPVSALSDVLTYHDLNEAEALLKQETYACLIMEPCGAHVPQSGYLAALKELCERHGSLLIFDEIVTGFRLSLGGAQSYFGVTPHLSCFGKAMANGMPLSTLVGRADIMDTMEEIFYSGTFGGETLSLAASLATIEKMERCGVVDHLWTLGETLTHHIEALITKYGLLDVMTLKGFAPWKLIHFEDHQKASAAALKTFFIQEMIARGILINASLNLTFAHQSAEKEKIITAFEDVLSFMADALEDDLTRHLKSPVIQPLFKIR